MIIGLLSDTHSRLSIANRAVQLLQKQGAEYLIHCGDLCDEQMLDSLAGLASSFVFGNNDYERTSIKRYADMLNINCLQSHGIIELAGKRICVTHGDDDRLMKTLSRGEGFDYLLTGHTHIPHDRPIGQARWINPGALHRATPKTCATLNLKTNTLQLLQVSDETR